MECMFGGFIREVDVTLAHDNFGTVSSNVCRV